MDIDKKLIFEFIEKSFSILIAKDAKQREREINFKLRNTPDCYPHKNTPFVILRVLPKDLTEILRWAQNDGKRQKLFAEFK